MFRCIAALVCTISIGANTLTVAHGGEGSMGGRRGSGLRGSNNGNVDRARGGYNRNNRRRDLGGGYKNGNGYYGDNGAWIAAPVLIDNALAIDAGEDDDSSNE